MSIEENKVIARRFVEEMMNGQHMDRIDEFVAPDAVSHTRHDEANYRQRLREVFSDGRPDWRFTVDDVIAEDDKVVVRCTASYITWIDRNMLGTPYEPGTRATVWHIHIFRIHDGQITDHWPVRDDWDAVVQFSAPVTRFARQL
ncbi:MAG TPA: nuclear transport factor 2 family protein [Chloroflexota bacterium]